MVWGTSFVLADVFDGGVGLTPAPRPASPGKPLTHAGAAPADMPTDPLSTVSRLAATRFAVSADTAKSTGNSLPGRAPASGTSFDGLDGAAALSGAGAARRSLRPVDSGVGGAASGASLGSEPAVTTAPRGGGDSAPPAPVPLFMRGTDDAYVGRVYDKMSALWGDPKYWLTSRWSGAQGSPRSLTWSFVPDGLSISSGVGEPVAPSELFSRMDSLFSSQGGRATWVMRFEQSLARWTQLSGVTYTRITYNGNDWDDGASWGSPGSSTRGDIRISMKPIDGANGILAYTYFPSNGDMVLDRQENWASTSNTNRFMRDIVMHENGHSLGLLHVCSNNQDFLMEPFLNTSFDGPRHDDIRAIQRQYGDPFEDDNSAATANDLGTLTSGVPLNSTCNLPPPLTGSNPASTSDCSIDADGEQDFFKFQVAASSFVSVSVTPLGFSYDDNAQSGNGNCPSGNTTNSLTKANLNVQLIGPNGSTVLATADTAPSGQAEFITNRRVGAGTYYIRVYEGDSPTQTQLYSFSVTAVNLPKQNLGGSSPPPPTLTPP
jgi:hypothetical protein